MAVLPSKVRIVLLRRFAGAVIGPGAHIAFGSVLRAQSIELGANARIEPLTYIRASTFILGPRATIGALCVLSANHFELGPQAHVSRLVEVSGNSRDPRCRFRAGMASWVFTRCFIDVTRPVELGTNVGVGGSSFLFTHGLWLSSVHGFPVTKAPIVIDDDTWIPWRCFIMPGVTIGKRVIIGAQSLVNRDVPDNVVAAGMPAKVIREPSARPMQFAERYDILRSLVEEFAARRERAAVEKDADGRLVLSIDGRPTALLNTDRSAPREGAGLNLVWTSRSSEEYRSKRLYCVEDFHCSPWDELSPDQRDLLESFRSEGLRAYPVDEVEWAPRAGR